MKEEILNFINQNKLSPFNQTKTQLKINNSLFKTSDAKKVHTKTMQKISENFVFPDTSNIINFFEFTNSEIEIKKRQLFFKEILKETKFENDFLKNIKKSKPTWKPPYDIVIVTEDAETFNELKKRNCPVELIVSESDLILLESREIIQIINCQEYGQTLESLPQSIFLKSINEVYLERHLERFSSYIEIIKILKKEEVNLKLKEIINELSKLIFLTKEENEIEIDPKEINSKIIKANELILNKIKQLNFDGNQLIEILSLGKLPKEIKEIIYDIIDELNIPNNILEIQIPLKINEEELENLIKKQNENKFSKIAETIKENSEELKKIPKRIKELENELLFFDFISGISKFVKEDYLFSEISKSLEINNSKNIFLNNPQEISFNLSDEIKGSVLTGANSGGKTTLIEHLIQLISISKLGLPCSGKNKIPLFEEIYYFAKNKGSDLKGAFETLLMQMSKIKPGNKTLILADEIESVTEPGVAGNIIAATIDYYIKKNCFLLIATHLGHEIKKVLPNNTRIDGIEATGLTDNFELIVNHNPQLGKLANSTPELIVEKMAKKEQKDYFIFLNNFLKKENNNI